MAQKSNEDYLVFENEHIRVFSTLNQGVRIENRRENDVSITVEPDVTRKGFFVGVSETSVVEVEGSFMQLRSQRECA